MEKVLRKFKDIPQNDIIEKFKMNEEIMNAEINIFLLVKVILLYLAPMFKPIRPHTNCVRFGQRFQVTLAHPSHPLLPFQLFPHSLLFLKFI